MPPALPHSDSALAVAATAALAVGIRAAEQAQPRPLLDDPWAIRLTEHLATRGIVAPPLPPESLTHLAVCGRALCFDHWVRQWLVLHPAGPVVTLGAGYCTRQQRLQTVLSQTQHILVDQPHVLNLRRGLFTDERQTSVDLANATVVEHFLGALPDGPKLFVAEGLLMYLPRPAQQRLLQSLCDICPGSTLLFDAYQPLAAFIPTKRGPTGLLKLRLETTGRWPAKLRRAERFDLGQDARLRERVPGWVRQRQPLRWLYGIFRAETAAP